MLEVVTKEMLRAVVRDGQASPPAQAHGEGDRAGAADERIPAGRRNSTLTSLADTMRRRDMSEEVILAALSVTDGERCDPPLGQAEVRRIARSVARYEPARG